MKIIEFIISSLIEYVILYLTLGRKLSAIGYSGSLWVIASIFGGLVAFPLASSLPDRRVEARRSEEEALLDQQLRQASLPVTEGGAVVPRATISDDLTRAGEV